MKQRKIYTLGGKELKKFFKENPDIADGLIGDDDDAAYFHGNENMHCTIPSVAKSRGYKHMTTLEFIDYLKQVMKAKEAKKAVRTIRTAAAKPKVDLTEENELLKKANQELTVKLAIAKQLGDETIQDLEKRLDLAYKEQEDMLEELNKCVNATIRHCDQVQYNTGSIKLHDVEYCADMIKRILDHKFGYKPKMQEI